MTAASGKRIVVAGCGGNIGSHLVPHLARMPEVGEVLLIDPDTYEASNLRSQDIEPRDVGRAKARVQARRLKRLNPDLKVSVHVGRLEELPLGAFRADVLLAGLDSRAARMALNEAAWRLGVPWIDGGVDGSQLLARVNVYLPGPEAPCLECAWNQDDYAAVEVVQPCIGEAVTVATNAPSSVGALTGALMAVECRKLLRGETARSLASRQVLMDLQHHRHYVTKFQKNPHCLAAHDTWEIEHPTAAGQPRTLGDLFSLAERPGAVSVETTAGKFVRRLACAACGIEKEFLGLARVQVKRPVRCRSCRQPLQSRLFDEQIALTLENCAPADLKRPLKHLGFAAGDVVLLKSADGTRFLELAEPRSAGACPVEEPAFESRTTCAP